jgi:hypothetical protein
MMQRTRFRVLSPILVTLLPTLALSSQAFAQGVSDGVGDIGLTFGYNDVDDTEGDTASVGFAIIDGSYSFHVAPRVLLGFDANFRFDDLASDPDFNDEEDPESQLVLGAHALWELGADTRLGGFLAYGDTKMQDEVPSNNYDYYLVGLEARHFVNDNVMLYGQLALGDKVRDGDDEGEGLNDGQVVRLGATYFAGERSAFTLDLEYATASPYIDGDDDGEFFGATLSGETRLGTQAPLFATYYVRYDDIDATTENDKIEELTVGIGIKYMFGAGSSREAARAGRSIGTPHLPARASIWTERID